MNARHMLLGALGAVTVAASGCYETTWFYPAPGQGSLVTNGSRLGVAKRLSGDDAQAQSFVVMSVHQAYTAAAEGRSAAGGRLQRTIVQVTANVVNRAAAPARFETDATRLEVAGRAFAPKWVYRSPPAGASGRDEIAPGRHVKFDLFFDLEPHALARYSGAPPVTGGIPLWSMKEFTVSWKAEWAGEKTAASFRFVRDYTGSVGGGWRAAPGPHWGFGWYVWPYPWPTGIVVTRPYYPWRASLIIKGSASPAKPGLKSFPVKSLPVKVLPKLGK